MSADPVLKQTERMLAIALVMALLARGFRYPLSFRLAERVLRALEKPR